MLKNAKMESIIVTPMLAVKTPRVHFCASATLAIVEMDLFATVVLILAYGYIFECTLICGFH